MKICVLGMALLLGGCALEPVEPWARANLAQPQMAWDAGLAQESAIRAHTYSSKEAASGNGTLAASGCGCK